MAAKGYGYSTSIRRMGAKVATGSVPGVKMPSAPTMPPVRELKGITDQLKALRTTVQGQKAAGSKPRATAEQRALRDSLRQQKWAITGGPKKKPKPTAGGGKKYVPPPMKV